MLKFQFWAFVNGRANIGRVRSFSGPLSRSRGLELIE